MLKRYHRFFQSLQVLRDAVLVAVAFGAAYWARFSLPGLLPFSSVSPWQETLAVGAMVTVIWPAVGWISGLYVSRRVGGIATELFDVFKVTVLSFLVLVVLAYFSRDVRYSRGVLILWAPFTFVLLACARAIFRVALRKLRRRGYNLRHVLVVGVGSLAERVVRAMEEHGELGLRVVGVVAPEQRASGERAQVAGAPVLGGVRDMQDIFRTRTVDQVIVALPIDQLGVLKDLMEVLSQETVDVRLVPDFYQFMTLCGGIEEFSGMPIINLQATPLLGWHMVAKRAFDVVVAGLGLLLISPAFLTIALLVRLGSRGPVFYKQERVGMDGQCFEMFKFRTMRVDAEAGGARMAVRDDDRCTGIGRFLRRTSLDELPQLLNVIVGDMSLVGPRPERPCFVEDFKREIPRYALRHKIKAGMTGWAQINGLRGNTSIAKRIELDLYYIENWSLLLDIKILVRTVFGGFLSPNAY